MSIELRIYRYRIITSERTTERTNEGKSKSAKQSLLSRSLSSQFAWEQRTSEPCHAMSQPKLKVKPKRTTK